MTMTPRAKAKNTARCAALALSLAVPIIATAIPSDAAAMAEDIPYGSKAESAHYETGRIDYQRNSQGTWVEKATDGSYRFEYVETGRDSDSVYIYDASRSLRLKLDFKTWMVSVSFNGAPYAESFKMTSIATLSEGRRPMPPASATTPANNNQQGFRPPYQQGNSQPGLGNLPRQGSTQQGYPAQGYPQQGNSQGNTQQTYRPQGY
ncbi:MAG: hypothetical protein P8J20_17040, partial [Novosphingobium sp.]|nr:hypothetical protein [Novosphingobium sp.]